ncbi:MAG TPA: DoxX family protein [Gammaproteobacteria bacterium]|nr:DoxX family protein [Gammaproteobacteria bacterium]
MNEDHGKLVLRLMLGLLTLFHGIDKVIGGIDGIMGRFENIGLPGAIAYLVYLGEVAAPILMVIGFWTRLAAFVVAGNMVVVILLAHSGDLLSLTPNGGYRLELQFFFLLSSIAIIALGAGRYSVAGARGKWN